MRLDPKLVHPSIFRATDALTWRTAKSPRAALRQQTTGRAPGGGCIALFLGGLILFIVGGLFMKEAGIDRAIRVSILLSYLFVMVVLGAYGLFGASRRITAPELDAVLPSLELGPSERAYAETLVALYRAGRPEHEIEETMVALNALLDEESQLRESLERAAGREAENDLGRLREEAEAVRSRAAESDDPVAKDAYAQSLALLDERIVKHRSSVVGLERTEAHLVLLRQALLATRDAARRLEAAPEEIETGLEIDGLRAAIANARDQTLATERALEELNAR